MALMNGRSNASYCFCARHQGQWFSNSLCVRHTSIRFFRIHCPPMKLLVSTAASIRRRVFNLFGCYGPNVTCTLLVISYSRSNQTFLSRRQWRCLHCQKHPHNKIILDWGGRRERERKQNISRKINLSYGASLIIQILTQIQPSESTFQRKTFSSDV